MKKLLVIVLAVLFVLPVVCGAQEVQSKWAKGTGGVFCTYGQFQKAEFSGIFNVEGLLRLKGDKLYGGAQYRKINNEGLSFNDLTAMIYLYTRDLNKSIEDKKPQLYLKVGVGGAHETGTLAVVSVNGGFGLLIPTPITNTGGLVVELTGFNIFQPSENDVSSILFTAGIQAGLDF